MLRWRRKCPGLGDGQTAGTPWQKLGDRTMRQVGQQKKGEKHERPELESSLQVSVGGCGMWGVAKDNSLWFRVGTAGRTAEWAGDNWTKVRILTSTIT